MCPRTIAGWTMLAFGLLTVVTGVCGIVAPGLIEGLLGVAGTGQRHVFILPTSVAATAMGVYYTLAACHDLRPFFGWTVPMRVVNGVVFAGMALWGGFPTSFVLLAAWELSGAACTGAALLIDRRSATGRTS